MIYLDHAASTPIREKVLNSYIEFLKHDFANSMASHRFGKSINEKIENTRLRILNFLKLDKEKFNLLFTSSATESNNLVFNSVQNKKHVVSKTDHPSIVLASEKRLPLNEIFYFAHQKNGDLLLPPNVENNALYSISHVNGTFGIIYDLSILREIKSKNNLIHLDLSQSFGKIADDYSFADFITFSSHKIGAPKGVSCLIYQKNITLRPFLIGGGQENGLRASTLNAPAILALGETINIISKEMNLEMEKINLFKERLITFFEEKYNFVIPFKISTPHILTVITKGFSSDIIQRYLEDQDIIVATSAACSSKKTKINQSYLPLHIDEKDHNSVLRISFGHNTSEEEISQFMEKFDQVMKKLRILC